MASDHSVLPSSRGRTGESSFSSASTSFLRPLSNPFATRFICPGATPYHFQASGRLNTSGRLRSGNRWVDPWGQEQEQAIEQLVSALKRSQCGAIIGPHGSGKSTLIATIEPRLRQEFRALRSHTLRDEGTVEVIDLRKREGAEQTETGMVAMERAWSGMAWRAWARRHRCGREVVSFLRGIGPGELAVIEGAEQLSVGSLRRLTRRARRQGWYLLITAHRDIRFLQTIHRTAVSKELIEHLAEELISDCPTELASKITAKLETYDLRRVTNLRELWFELYDVVQDHLIRSAGKQGT